jgi:DNA (cytosine-5)-methyltransferase 1
MIADDLFAGAGGWDLAAANLGIHARGIENMKEARATRDAAGLTTIHDDVWTFEPDGNAEGLIASPPCQTFSAAGKGAGRKALDDVLAAIWTGAHMDIDALRDVGEQVGDQRTALVLTPLHFAMTGGYEWLAWEQVPTVLPVWQACVEVLRAAGWKAWAGLAQAEMYGVPQTRKRAFLIASRHGIAETPPTYSRYHSRSPERLDEGVAKWVSMAEALGWPPGQVVSNYNRGGVLGNPGTRSIDAPAFTVTSKSDRDRVRFLRMTKMANSAQRNVDEPVARITIREAGILQSFPAGYPWQGNKGKQFLQVGNAVPPGLAHAALAAATGIRSEAKGAA